MESRESPGSPPIDLATGERKCLYTPEEIIIPSACAPLIKGILIPNGLIRDRVQKMAYDIRNCYKGGELHMLCLLKGARTFFGDLSSFIYNQKNATNEGIGPEPFHHFLQISTYKNGLPTDEVTFVAGDLSCLKGKEVLIVDDVVESGKTLQRVRNWLQQFNPKAVRTAGLVQIRIKGEMPSVDFVGFTGPEEWLVGYGIDYNDSFRDLLHICVLNESAKKALRV